jgi:hypothetical protein
MYAQKREAGWTILELARTNPTCWSCGDPPQRAKRRGHGAGLYCLECYREKAWGQLPQLRRPPRRR